MESKKRYRHESIPNWTGAPDNKGLLFVGDIKCPFTLASFCCAVDAFGDIKKLKDKKPEHYWQLISNAILTGKNLVELVIYAPYLYELEAIRKMVNTYEGNPSEVSWIQYADDDELPYLIEGGQYKNLNTFRFIPPAEDILFLTESVKMANLLLE